MPIISKDNYDDRGLSRVFWRNVDVSYYSQEKIAALMAFCESKKALVDSEPVVQEGKDVTYGVPHNNKSGNELWSIWMPSSLMDRTFYE